MDAVQLEEVEAAAWADLLEALPAARRSALGISWERSQARAILRSAGLGSPLFNRIIGLGAGEPATRDAVRVDLASFPLRGIDRYFVHLSPRASPAGLRGWLEQLGLVRYPRSWVKLVRGREAPPAARTDLKIQAARPALAPQLGRIFVEGFQLGPAAAPIFEAMVGRPGWYAYVALDGTTPAAAAALFIRDGVGYLAGAATLPSYRCRGAQAALMSTRIEVALDLGCHTLATETGEAVPGDPQHSYRNMRKAGFREAYVRENYAPPGTRW